MPKVLISVSNKTNLVEHLAKPLADLGWEIIASGGTANHLRENMIPAKDISEITGSPEILNGRVKTLHPIIHGGILAREMANDLDDLSTINAELIDMVVVNLYPFEEVIANQGVELNEAIENIDIGGVALIRGAAKNFTRMTVIVDPTDYAKIAEQIRSTGEVGAETRKQLAVKAFAQTTKYDAAIANFLSQDETKFLNLTKAQELRYGENPHQNAALYTKSPDTGPLGGALIQGKALSFNNLLDLDAAWRAAISFKEPTIAIIKHLSPCGIASGKTLKEAYPLALASDPVSAFGSVIAANQEINLEAANQMEDLFIECIIAPGFSPEAKAFFNNKKKLRLIEMPDNKPKAYAETRSILNGFLVQDIDLGDPMDAAKFQVVTKREPNQNEWDALKFAWVACQHVKSNAIVFAKGSATTGIGGGQPNRLDCVHIAAKRAGENSKGSVMASDAFFPFPDSIEAAAKYGITAVIQPGGSVNDQLSIEAANQHNMTMVFTGFRHFRH